MPVLAGAGRPAPRSTPRARPPRRPHQWRWMLRSRRSGPSDPSPSRLTTSPLRSRIGGSSTSSLTSRSSAMAKSSPAATTSWRNRLGRGGRRIATSTSPRPRPRCSARFCQPGAPSAPSSPQTPGASPMSTASSRAARSAGRPRAVDSRSTNCSSPSSRSRVRLAASRALGCRFSPRAAEGAAPSRSGSPASPWRVCILGGGHLRGYRHAGRGVETNQRPSRVGSRSGSSFTSRQAWMRRGGSGSQRYSVASTRSALTDPEAARGTCPSGSDDGRHQGRPPPTSACGLLRGGTGGGHLGQLRARVGHLPGQGHRRGHALRSAARQQPDLLTRGVEAGVVGQRSAAGRRAGRRHRLGRRQVRHGMQHGLDSLGGRAGHGHS